MRPQGMARRHIGMVKIMRLIARHADFFHHPNRTGIFHCREGNDFFQPQIIEPECQARARGLRPQTLPPCRMGKAPADFHRRQKRRVKISRQQTGKTAKRAVLFFMNGQQRKTVRRLMRHDALQKSGAFITAQSGRKKFHHPRIGVHRRHIVQMPFGK